MKRGCSFYLVSWAIAAAAYWYLLRDRILPGNTGTWLPILVGFFMAMVIGMIKTSFDSIGDVRRVRQALEPGGFTGEQPRDGQNLAVAGHIRPLGMPLTAPFSHKRAVLYNYEVEHPGTSSRRGNTGPTKDYSGLALTPSVIDTTRGQVKLLCFPQIEGETKEVVFGPDALRNAQDYIRATQWGSMTQINPAQIYREVRELLTDDDGQIRKDFKIHGCEDLSGATLIEQVVEPGAQVFAFGRWSEEKRGLIPDQGVPARMVVGDTSHVLKTLRGKVISGFIFALVFAGVVNGILWLFVTRS
jgi:hypothetical protein